MGDFGFSIDLSNLKGSDLNKLCTTSQQASVGFASELKQHLGAPIRLLVGLPPVQFSISSPSSCNWKTSTGVGFTVKASATCKVSVGAKCASFKVAKAVDSSETQDLAIAPPAGGVYINIEIGFDIQGNLSAAGKVGGFGIGGKVSAAGSPTFAYCHPIDGSTETSAAIREAFSSLKLPFQPDSVTQMPVGAVSNVKFDGSLGLELDLSYGLGSCSVAAPGLSAVKKSLQIASQKFTVPTPQVEAGVKATFTYKHSEQFEAIVRRDSQTGATLFLSRSSTEDAGESVSLSLGVQLTSPPASKADSSKLASSVNQATNGEGGAQAAGLSADVEAALVAKSSSWLTSTVSSDLSASLKANLEQQKSRVLLYEFSADLTNEAIAEHTWDSFGRGDLISAMQIGGLKLLPGSGVGDLLKRSVTVHLQFLNLFAMTDTQSYFKNTYTNLAPDGSIRYSFDIGKEGQTQFRKALDKTTVHFVASAPDLQALDHAEIDLCIELVASKDAKHGTGIASAISGLASSQDEGELRQFLHDTPQGKLTVDVRLEPAVYQSLQSGNDAQNWQAFQRATVALLGLPFASLTYDDWALFNRYANGGVNPQTGQPYESAPDRKNSGNPAAVPDSFYSSRGLEAAKQSAEYFLLSSAQFMNLCADLVKLGQNPALSDSDTKSTWDSVTSEIVQLVLNDVNTDWSLPATKALLGNCRSSDVSSNLERQKSALTYSMKLGA